MIKRCCFFIVFICLIGIVLFYKNNNPPVVTKINTSKISMDDLGRSIHDPSNVACLINKENTILDAWQPTDLLQIDNEIEGKYYLRKVAALSWNEMHKDAKSEGVSIYVISSYRTKEYQEQLYNKYLATDPINAPYYSAKPRSSEHELGLAIDISYDIYLHHDIQDTSIGKWMEANAYKYGWVMRYPDQKIDITGYVFESWHYRYVGVQLATTLKNQNITLEEYYQK